MCGTFTPDPPSDDGGLPSNTATLEYLGQTGACGVVSTVTSPIKDEKSATGDAVASGIEFVEEWEKYTARAKEVILSVG
jgi:hypothetical protein